tara:strand:- start:1806 stop:3101 length:1296 start_codon:yes stop_codon:yes gene_type:complete
MDFHGKSSSRSISSVSAAELSQYNTHLILAMPSWEYLTSSYKNFFSSFAQELMNTVDKKVSLEIPLNTQMKIFAFLFKENYSMYELFSITREVGYYGESQPFSIDAQTNNLSLGISLIQVPSTGNDTDGDTDTAEEDTVTGGSNDTGIDTDGEDDTTSPSNTSISINSNADNATSTSVMLSISATDSVGVTGYYVSESSTAPANNVSGWVSVTSTTSYSANVSFTLSSVDNESKTVFAWFKDSAGNISLATSDSIMAVYYYWKLIAKQVDSDSFTDGTDELFLSNARGTFLENENDPSQSTFMSIGNLEKSNYADTDERYKFKLLWGGQAVDSSGITKEVTWTQTSWLTESTITSFTEIGTSGYVTGDYGQGFFGLAKSTRNECVLDGDGSSHNYWWNCAGAISKHNGGIPGPLGKIASSMYLYIWSPSNL